MATDRIGLGLMKNVGALDCHNNWLDNIRCPLLNPPYRHHGFYLSVCSRCHRKIVSSYKIVQAPSHHSHHQLPKSTSTTTGGVAVSGRVGVREIQPLNPKP